MSSLRNCCRSAARIFGAFFALTMAADSGAQSQRPTRVDEVVVTATRFEESPQAVPIGVTVVTQDDIRNSTAATVPELLRQYPGVQVRDNTGSPNQQVDIRGFGITGDQNTLVLVDGQRISENEQITANWASIPLSAIERIEIVRGSGAVLYGGGATGGTINIITKAPLPSSRSAYASGGYGSYGTGDYRAGVNLAGSRFGMTADAGYLGSDNYRDNNGLRQQNARVDLRFTGERGTLYAKFGANDQHLQLPGALSDAQIAANRRQAATPGDFTHISGGDGNLGGDVRFGDAVFAMNAGYRGRNTNGLFFAATPFFRNNTNTQVGVTSLTPRARIPFALGATGNTLVTGIDWDRWDYDSTGSNPAAHPLAGQRNSAWYVQNTTALGAATTLSVGGRVQRTRYDVNDIVGIQAAARDRTLRAFEIGARHNFTEAFALYGRFGNSFRIPNVNDIYNLITATVTMLEPQTSHDREIGAELKAGGATYRLALYAMDVNNEIHLDPIAFNNVNLPPTRRYGAELEGKWNPAAGVSVFANHTYTVARFREGILGGLGIAGNDVPLVPRNRANLGAAWEFMPRTRVNAFLTYVGEQLYDADELNIAHRKMPSYTLVDLKLSHETRGWLLGAGVKNLFNEKYFSYGVFSPPFPLPPAAPLFPAAFFAYPAAERSFFVSAQYTFR